MKREACPNCGGVLVAESLGWKCKSCKGFISLQDGKFYEYVEKPFMPKTTNADRIRAMSDEELAEFMFSMVDCVSCENKLMNNGKLVFGDKRKTCTDKDYHAMCNGDGRKCEAVCLEWLKQPAKDGDDDG